VLANKLTRIRTLSVVQFTQLILISKIIKPPELVKIKYSELEKEMRMHHYKLDKLELVEKIRKNTFFLCLVSAPLSSNPSCAPAASRRLAATIWSAPPPSLHNYLVLPPFRELIRGKRAHLAARSREFVAAVHRNMTARYQVKSLRSCRVAGTRG
jgi:hypothetical protein